MPRNIEIKAKIARVDTLLPKVAAIASQGPVEIAQDDTFFRCESGRLKLRTLSPSAGQLISSTAAPIGKAPRRASITLLQRASRTACGRHSAWPVARSVECARRAPCF
jgi:hypothetical protein